jgi:hypothetical protein
MSKKRVTTQQREAVTQRSQGCCEYCLSQLRFAMSPFSVEHIIPRHRGGKTELDNLALSCQGCNGHKHTKVEGHDPVTGGNVPLYHPRHQKWADHLTWSEDKEDKTKIVGLTPTGRATVITLKLNRSGLVNLRHVLYIMGKHPPDLVQE